MAEQLSMFEPPKRKSGLLYLPKYLTIGDQKDLLNDLRTVVRQAPLFTPTMSSGSPFRYKMTNIGDLGWVSDRRGYRYESRHPVTGQPYPEIPSSLRSMIADLSSKFGEQIRPDAVLLNWYPDGAKLGLHVDNTEKVSKPVVSLSLGDRGVFAIDTTGSRDRSTAMKNLERINVNSGDAIVFGGDLRNAYHAVERIDAGTAPPELGMKNSGRINLTARQVNKISGGGFGNPVAKFAKGFAMREGARLLAKQLGANEDQQQAVADTVTAANILGGVYQNATRQSGIYKPANPTVMQRQVERLQAKGYKDAKLEAFDPMKGWIDEFKTYSSADFKADLPQYKETVNAATKRLLQSAERLGVTTVVAPFSERNFSDEVRKNALSSRAFSAAKNLEIPNTEGGYKPYIYIDTVPEKQLSLWGTAPMPLGDRHRTFGLANTDLFAHELGHIALGHVDPNRLDTPLHYLAKEIEADAVSYGVLKKIGLLDNPALKANALQSISSHLDIVLADPRSSLLVANQAVDPFLEISQKTRDRINNAVNQIIPESTESLKLIRGDRTQSMANKKINTGSVSSSVKESNRPKLTSDIIANYLDLMGGEKMVVRPDGSQYSPNRKGRVNIGDRMTTSEKFGQASDVGLNNDFTKLPEIHARFDDRRTALQVQKEIATGRLTTQRFYQVPTQELAEQVANEIRQAPDLLGRGETLEIRKAGEGFEVVAVKQYQPIPSRGNTLVRTYGAVEHNALKNDPTGIYVAFNKPEEAYKAPKSLKELQAESRSQQLQLTNAYKELNVSPDMTKRDYLAAIKPRMTELESNEPLRLKAKLVLDDIASRDSQLLSQPVAERGWDKIPARSPMTEQVMQQAAIASEPQPRLNSATDTGGWANAQGESLVTLENVDQKRMQVADERSSYAKQKAPFASQRLAEVDRYGVGAPLDDETAYSLAKRKFETIKRSALDFPDAFQGVDQSARFPSLSSLKRQALSEGIMLADSGTNAFKAYADAKAAELTGMLKIPESGLPVTARLGQEYISPKTGKIGTVESVGKKGVKLNVDGQTIPIEYETLERLKYTGNKQWGFGSMPALRPANAGLLGGTLGAIAFKQLAKAAGLNEDQQNIAAGVGGVTGAITGGSLSLFKPTTELKAPTARQFAQTVMGIPAPSESGMFLTAEGRNKMRLNQLNQYDVKPVLSDAAVIATDLLTPHPYGIATVPAARMATDSWKNNYDAIAERGLAAMKTTATGATSAIKDFTYQTLSQLGRSVGLPFPMTEQAVGQVLDTIPNAEQVMGMAKSRFARNSESGMVMMGDQLQAARRELDAKYPDSLRYDRTAKPEPRKPVPFLTFDQAADQMSMSPSEYRAFQDRVYAEQQAVQSKPYQERQNQIAKQKFQQEQSYFDALKAWNKAGDPTIPMPRKEDFVSPIKNTFDFKQTLSEASMAARSAESRAKGFGKPQPKSAIAQATQAIKNAGEIVLDALYQPSAANPSRASSPKQSNFVAESEVQKAAAATGVSEARVKAEIASQRASGEAPNLSKATEAIATRTQSKELAPRSLAEMQNQSKALSNRVLSRQQSDGMITTPSQKMIDAGLKDQKVKLSDRIGTSGLGVVMDTAQAANVLTESVSRGENAPTALTRAGVSVGAGYAATGLASFIPNPYLRTAAQLGGGIAAVIGADKAIDAVVGRNEAKEQKYAKDLSKLDLQPTNESEQWKPFVNDDNGFAAYGNSFAAQIQSNLDYRPAARSLANLANNQSIENARYQSERQTSLQSGMDAKAKKSITFEKRDDGTEVGYLRNRGYNATESRVLALQNLANEHGYEVPRTGKFEAKTLDALEKLGYSQSQISAYIQGKTDAIGKPNQVTPDKVNAAKVALARSRGEQVSSSELSAALSAERKAQGLKGGEMLNQGQVDRVFQSLAGRSLSQLRQSAKVGGNKTQSALRLGAGISKQGIDMNIKNWSSLEQILLYFVVVAGFVAIAETLKLIYHLLFGRI